MDLTKNTLSEKDRARFRMHWQKYCKDISPKRALRFLSQSFDSMSFSEVTDTYKEWREEYLKGSEW